MKFLQFTVPITATSNEVTLTAALHGGVASIVGVVGAVITGGMDADYTAIQVSFSGLVVTILSLQADGAAADEFTGTTCTITLLIKTTA